MKGHEDGNRHKNRIKRSGQARLVYVKNINRNIPTTWRWARGDYSLKTRKGNYRVLKRERRFLETCKHRNLFEVRGGGELRVRFRAGEIIFLFGCAVPLTPAVCRDDLVLKQWLRVAPSSTTHHSLHRVSISMTPNLKRRSLSGRNISSTPQDKKSVSLFMTDVSLCSRTEENEVEWTRKAEIRKVKFLAVGDASKDIIEATLGLTKATWTAPESRQKRPFCSLRPQHSASRFSPQALRQYKWEAVAESLPPCAGVRQTQLQS